MRIVIVGPTGSGKTGVAIEIAEKIDGEIISADSRAIYKGMNIGTAKPSKEEQGRVQHYGLDLVNPKERFTVFDWKKYAEQKIKEIEARGKTVLVVGGTGLYVDALIFDYQFNSEVKNNCSDRKKIGEEYVVIGIETERAILRERLKKRLNKMFDQELFEETEFLSRTYGWDSQAMKSNIYQFVRDYRLGKLKKEEALEKSFYDDWQLARRQMTWFRRNPEIRWMKLAEVKDYVLKCIQDEQRKYTTN